MSFAFRFTSTHRDLLDAYDAHHTAYTGMRSWARGALITIGALLFLAGLVVIITGSSVEHWWQPVAWLGIGALIVFLFLVRPSARKRRIRRTTPPAQDVELRFGETGADVAVAGIAQYQRPWSEFLGVISGQKGVAIVFADGSVHWIPNRAFADSSQRTAFCTFLREHVRTPDRAA
jgi:hypothetical protein